MARHFVVRQMLPAPVAQDIPVGRASCDQFDERAGGLAPTIMRHRDHGGDADRIVTVQDFFYLDRRDVLAAGNDDVFRPVLELNVAVRVDHPEVSRVEPPARESLLRGLRIAEISLHHDIPTEHDLSHRFTVAGHRLHGFRIKHVELFEREIPDTLPRFEACLFGRWKIRPAFVPVIDHGGTVSFRQSIEMRHLEPSNLHIRQELFGRRCRGSEELHAVIQLPFDVIGGRDHEGHDDGCAAQVCDAFVGQRGPDRFGAHLSQAHMGSDDCR